MPESTQIHNLKKKRLDFSDKLFFEILRIFTFSDSF